MKLYSLNPKSETGNPPEGGESEGQIVNPKWGGIANLRRHGGWGMEKSETRGRARLARRDQRSEDRVESVYFRFKILDLRTR
jgi:hypothetical protein